MDRRCVAPLLASLRETTYIPCTGVDRSTWDRWIGRRGAVLSYLERLARETGDWASWHATSVLRLLVGAPRKFNSNSLTSWLKDKIEATLSRLYHIRARPRRVVGNARHIKASKIMSGSRRVVLMHPGALCSGVFLGSVNRSLVGKSVAFLSARGGKGGGPPNSRVGGAGDIYSHGCSLGAPGDGVLATSGWALLLVPKC
ncbi:hypothetical protein BHE74_00045994 [Ensete ventricosum]|nr:hypothetical protein BHE74_00045994 [Ensete ventricosum]